MALIRRCLKKNKQQLLPELENWIHSELPFTRRVGLLLLMKYFLDDDFKPEYLELPSKIRSEEYYVNMMTAWYFATALAKQYDAVLPFIEGRRLDPWTHNKAIQKAVESYRITPEQKAYLRTLKTGRNA